MKLQESFRSKNFELTYEQSIQKVDAVEQGEDERRLRLRILLLEGENNGLHDDLAEEQSRNDYLEKAKEDLRAQMNEREADLQRAQSDVRIRTRELDNLKVCALGWRKFIADN